MTNERNLSIPFYASVPTIFIEIKPTLWYGEEYYSNFDVEAELTELLRQEIYYEMVREMHNL